MKQLAIVFGAVAALGMGCNYRCINNECTGDEGSGESVWTTSGGNSGTTGTSDAQAQQSCVPFCNRLEYCGFFGEGDLQACIDRCSSTFEVYPEQTASGCACVVADACRDPSGSNNEYQCPGAPLVTGPELEDGGSSATTGWSTTGESTITVGATSGTSGTTGVGTTTDGNGATTGSTATSSTTSSTGTSGATGTSGTSGTACTRNQDCASDQDCVAGACLNRCVASCQCATGQVCGTDGYCRTPPPPQTSCTQDCDCQAGDLCVSGFCQTATACQTDCDCPAGHACTSGYCR